MCKVPQIFCFRRICLYARNYELLINIYSEVLIMLIHGELFKAFTMIFIEKSDKNEVNKMQGGKKSQLCLYAALSFYHNFMFC